MKITRYFQSCLLIEEGAARFIIDPSGQESTRLNEFGKLDAVIYTHEHSDHFDADVAQQLSANGAKLYANASTAKQMKSPPTIVEDGMEFEVGGIKIKAYELPHCLMWDGTQGPQNTGYLIADKFFHPGDGKQLEGLSVSGLGLPINGPDISLMDAFNFAKQLSSKEIIPIHYDYLGGNTKVLADVGKGMGLNFHVVDVAESVEI
jgi:L-ascorbate metabolism protein UlaG (beta-lactamase superfamily)